MTTITRAPLNYWASGGEVFARVPGSTPAVLDDQASRDLLDYFEEERRAADVSGDKLVRASIMESARQLTAARIQASRWARASGDIPRAA